MNHSFDVLNFPALWAIYSQLPLPLHPSRGKHLCKEWLWFLQLPQHVFLFGCFFLEGGSFCLFFLLGKSQMFSSCAEASQPELGFLCFPVDYLLLAKCEMKCTSWMHGISSIFSSFTLCDRVGDGVVEHEGSCGVWEYTHVCVGSKWCVVWEENGIFSLFYFCIFFIFGYLRWLPHSNLCFAVMWFPFGRELLSSSPLSLPKPSAYSWTGIHSWGEPGFNEMLNEIQKFNEMFYTTGWRVCVQSAWRLGNSGEGASLMEEPWKISLAHWLPFLLVDLCVDFLNSSDWDNRTVPANATSPVVEFWEYVITFLPFRLLSHPGNMLVWEGIP